VRSFTVQRESRVKMVPKISTWYTSTVEALFPHYVSFSVETRRVEFQYTKMCTFSCVPMSGNTWKKTVEEGKEGNYGFRGVVLVGISRTCPCRTHHPFVLPFVFSTICFFSTEILSFCCTRSPVIWWTFSVVSGLRTYALGQSCDPDRLGRPQFHLETHSYGF
jgi:hypothetical protein